MKSLIILLSLSVALGLSGLNAQIHNFTQTSSPLSTGQKVKSVSAPGTLSITPSDNTSVPLKRNCGTTEYMDQQLAQDPSWKKRLEELETFTENFSQGRDAYKTQAVITIPVVVHIVYKNANENISDAQVLSQIAVLNEDFRKLNADTNLIPSVFKPLAADPQIEFCMAVQDPNGNPTTGITRTQTATSTFTSNNGVKSASTGGVNPWPVNKYLNIWVCNLGGGLLGYAQFPGGSASTDGVVVGYKYFGTIGTASAPYDKGRTATHEIGHWLNLRHVWGDANCGNDFVSDTPTSQAANYGCPSFPNVTCGNGPDGDMFMNYMDYADDACMQMFTAGQTTRMLAALNGPRSALLTSDGCTPLNAPPSTDFVASSQVILAGGTTNFTDLSLYTPTSWSWSFTGGNPSTSTLQYPSGIVYSTPGVYPVTLTASNGNGSDTETKTSYIHVINPGGPGACDTLNYPLLTGPYLYLVPTGSGFLTGTNSFGDQAKAVYISNSGAATHITGVMMEFGAATGSSLSSTIQVNVWDNTGMGGSPGNIIGTQNLLITDIITNGNLGIPSTAVFSNPIPITGPYYVGFMIPTTPGDTIAVLSDSIGTTVPGLTWEMFGNNWYEMSDGTSSFGYDLNLAIYPLVTNSPPTASFSVVNGYVCVGDTVNIMGNAANAQVYNWTFTGGTPATSTTINPEVSYLSAGTYDVTLTAVGSCLASSTLTQTAVIDVASNPSISVTPSVISVCPSASTTLTASGGAMYSWSPSTGLSSATGASVTATPAATTVYTVTGTNTAGCSNSATVNLTVVGNVPPVADFTVNPTSGCPGTTFNFTNTSTDAISYSWSAPNGSPSTSTQTDPVFTYTTPGSYPVTLVATGCSGSDTKTYNSLITITMPIVLVNPPADTILVGGNTSLTAIGGVAYSWSPATGLNATTGATVVASPTTTTTYTVTAVDNQGCSNSIDVVVTVDLQNSTDSELESRAWDLYPNPANEQITIRNVSSDLSTATFRLYDMHGKMLTEKVLNQTEHLIETRDFSSGMYVIEISRQGRVGFRKKCIIAH